MNQLNFADRSRLIKQILNGHVELCRNQTRSGLETLLISDDEKLHYILMNLGWQKGDDLRSVVDHRVVGMTVYVRIVDGKFWVEEDWTERGIAVELMAAGIPKENIVLAFHEPQMRPYTDFAVA